MHRGGLFSLLQDYTNKVQTRYMVDNPRDGNERLRPQNSPKHPSMFSCLSLAGPLARRCRCRAPSPCAAVQALHQRRACPRLRSHRQPARHPDLFQTQARPELGRESHQVRPAQSHYDVTALTLTLNTVLVTTKKGKRPRNVFEGWYVLSSFPPPRREAHQRVLTARESEALSRDELCLLEAALQLKGRDSFGRINYDQFKEVKESLGDLFLPSAGGEGPLLDPSVSDELMPKLDPYLRPSVFARFCKDPLGRVNVEQLLQYVHQRNDALQARVRMARFDGDGDGFLSEKEMRACLESVRRISSSSSSSL